METQACHTSRRCIGLIPLTVLAGFLGGIVSGLLWNSPGARAVTPYMPGSTFEAPPPVVSVANVPPGGIQYRTPSGQVVARLHADERGGRYEMLNSQGITVARLSTSADGGGNLTLYNRSGQPIFSASGD